MIDLFIKTSVYRGSLQQYNNSNQIQTPNFYQPPTKAVGQFDKLPGAKIDMNNLSNPDVYTSTDDHRISSRARMVEQNTPNPGEIKEKYYNFHDENYQKWNQELQMKKDKKKMAKSRFAMNDEKNKVQQAGKNFYFENTDPNGNYTMQMSSSSITTKGGMAKSLIPLSIGAIPATALALTNGSEDEDCADGKCGECTDCKDNAWDGDDQKCDGDNCVKDCCTNGKCDDATQAKDKDCENGKCPDKCNGEDCESSEED